MIDPEPRKRHALNAAWVVRCASPAVKPPTPSPMIMKPSWEIVEYASTFLMSFCVRAIVAAMNRVMNPM